MSTTTVEQTTTQENVKDSKSSQSVSETSQGTETKKKPGPKPKVKVEDTKSKEDAKSKEVTSTSTEIKSESAARAESENDEPQHTEAHVEQPDEAHVEQPDEAGTETSAETIKTIDSEYVPAHVLQRCPIYRTPSVKGVVLVMISGFVFANRTCTDGFYKVKYNSFERGTRTGYVESKYIAFGAKK